METWIEIADYPNYAVSNYGNVLNISADRLLKPRSNGQGYLRVTLSKNGVAKDHYIHHLVAAAFLDLTREEGEHIFHYNDDLEDNSPGNLRLRKRSRVILPENGPLRSGERVASRRHYGKRVRIKETGEVFRTVRDCARYIRGDYSTIYACLRGERRQRHRGYTFEWYDQ